MLRLWRLACLLGVLAGTSVIGFAFATRLPDDAAAPPHGSDAPTHEDRWSEIPSDWASYPVVARLDPSRATKTAVVDEGLSAEVRVSTAPLGDVFAQFQWDACIGGSTCTGHAPSLHHLRIGQLDDHGDPRIATAFACSGSSPLEPRGTTTRSCSPQTLALRRTPDGRTSVVTIRDPDAEEKPIVAFSRIARLGRPAVDASPRAARIVVLGLASALLLAGLLAALWGRRFLRRGGILAWRDGQFAAGMLQVAGEAALALSSGEPPPPTAVLVDPSVFVPVASYRVMPTIDRRHLFFGPRSAAAASARTATAAATVSFVASVVVSAMGFVAFKSPSRR